MRYLHVVLGYFMFQVQVQVYFALFKLVQCKMAYRINRLTNDEK